MLLKKYFLLFILSTFVCLVKGQTYPSALVTVISNPKTLFLDEYDDPLTPHIKTTIYFTDFTETEWSFSLRLKITGPNGILIQSNPTIKAPTPFIVSPGQAFEIMGADLSFYFNYDHLNFSGISRQQLEINNRLPEGLYQFSFEAIDYESGKVLSLPSVATAYLSLNDPPYIISPAMAGVVENISMQNILFQWQLSNVTGNLNLNQLAYQIDLYEVNNNWTNPVTAILNQQAILIWQSDLIYQTSFLYGISEPPLDKSKRYVYTVRVIENSGRCSFKNEGYSSPVYFQYGYPENDTIDVIKPVDNFQYTLSTASQFKWKKPRLAKQNQLVTYTLKLVEVDSAQDAEDAIVENNAFYQQTYLAVTYAEIEKTIPVTFWANIKRMGHYAWQVYAQSGTQQIAKSKVQTFIGPPEIENFIAGGFLMTVTRMDEFDKTNNRISGTCKTVLNSDWTSNEHEFRFNDIQISSIGSNEWVMSSGFIHDKISTPAYTLQPKTIPENKTALFLADSIYVSTSGLKLSGKIEWLLPHAGTNGNFEKLFSQRCKLNLANSTFYLNNSNPISLNKTYQTELMEPYGFILKLNESSTIVVYQSKYELNFNGFVQLPSLVLNQNETAAKIAFEEINQLFYIEQSENENSEEVILSRNTKFGFLPTTYTLDFSEQQSPGEFFADSSWKGLYIAKAKLQIPKLAESSGQISLASNKSFSFTNTIADTNKAFVTNHGLFLNATFPFQFQDSVKFNSFASKAGHFYVKINESEMKRGGIAGSIVIPVIDTLTTFPYLIELTEYGFNEGYLLNGLANTHFTFNPQGSADQQIDITIKRALFKNRNRIEMDLDLSWPYFNISIIGIQRFSVWGNTNIGFDFPNGKSALSYQAQGKSSNFDIMVDYLGCGRSGNAYAFGASAKINMDEEISGETGAPVINAYSIYKNSLLTAMGFVTQTLNPLSSGNNTISSNDTYQSSTSGYSHAISMAMEETITQLGFQNSDTLALNPLNPNGTHPLVPNNLVLQIKQTIDIVFRLKTFIAPNIISDKDWQILERFKNAMDNDIIDQSQYSNSKGLLNFVLNKVVESVIIRINQPIQNVSDKAIGKVRTAINTKIVNPINSKVSTSLNSIFLRLEKTLKAQVDETYHSVIHEVLLTTNTSISEEIKKSVMLSFENNITSKLNLFVQLAVTGKIKSFVRKEVSSAGSKLINDGANANISINDLFLNAGSLFENIADTIKTVIVSTNETTFIHTAESLVDDAIHGIDWNAVSNRVLNQLLAKGISTAVSNLLANSVSEKAGPYVGALLSTVKFDFSNLGEKLKNGQFDKIVKFDPTTIYIESPAVDIRGSLNFTKDDPTYGDSWQADVLVRVKVPKKENPIEVTAFFLNGKTTQQIQNFTYWFARLSVSGFTIPLNPAPVIWNGIEGFAYSKMKKTSATNVIPDKSNKFGLGCKFYFYDQASSGKTFLFDLGAEAEFNDGGFYIQLAGNASVLNFTKINGRYKSPGFVTGTGTLGYYKTPQCSKIAGNFSVILNTSPLICAGGDIGLDLKGPNDWKFWIGTQQNPIGIKILCKDFLSNTGYFEMNQSGFQTGLYMNVALSAQSPWLQFTNIKVRGFANLNFGYSAYASVEWDPGFKINEASIAAWLSANIGIEYETSVGSGSLTIAGVSLSGNLIYKSTPQSELHGNMAGSITVIGYSIGFSTPVHYSLSQQQIIN